MAATRLIALHVNKGKTVAQCLADRTDYSQNAAKTNDGEFISSYECDPKTADEEFLLSKRQYQHITGRQRGRIINDMIVNVGFVDVGRNDESVFSLCPSHRCFIADLVRFFRGDFSRLKGLAYLVCDDIVLLLSAGAVRCKSDLHSWKSAYKCCVLCNWFIALGHWRICDNAMMSTLM